MAVAQEVDVGAPAETSAEAAHQVALLTGRVPRERAAADLPAPRLTEIERQAVPAGVPLPHAAAGASQELAGVSYRWWLRQGRADLGLGLGTLGYLANTPGQPVAEAGRLSGTVPTVSVGLRYRVSDESVVYADALRARSLAASGADGYSAKVGVEWAPRKPMVRLDGGSLGLQLDSGIRMSLRLRKGKVGLYMRSNF